MTHKSSHIIIPAARAAELGLEDELHHMTDEELRTLKEAIKREVKSRKG